MKTSKKVALLFSIFMFAAFNAIFFLLGGSDSSAVWISYGVMCASFLFAVPVTVIYAKSERNFGIVYAYFIFNVILCTMTAVLKISSNTGIIIAEIAFGAIWIFLICIFSFANKHTVSSVTTQTSAVDDIRTQANRLKFLIGRYMDGKIDRRLENAYDDLRTLPAASIVKSGIIARLDLAVSELETAVKNENSKAIEESFSQLEDIIERIKNA